MQRSRGKLEVGLRLQETWQALEACVDKGYVRSLGISNFSPEKVDKWFSNARIYPAVNQVRTLQLCSGCVGGFIA